MKLIASLLNKSNLLVLVGAFALTSCASYGPQGLLYSGGTTGISTNNNVQPTKTGKACMLSILALVASGDASIEKAKAEGGITKVASVDYNAFNVLGVYGKYCTIVKGE